MKLLFNNNIEIYNLYEEILEEIKKGIIDLYEECKMDSLESQPLDIAYKNLSKFFGRLTELHGNLEDIRLIMCRDTNLEPLCDLLQGNLLIRYVLVDGKEHPQNLIKKDLDLWLRFVLEDYKGFPDWIEEISKDSLGYWENGWIKSLNRIKSTALETLDIEPLINEIHKVKKLLINKIRKDSVRSIFSEKEKETNTNSDNDDVDDFFNNLK